MIYTTGWTREKVKDEYAYQQWLDSICDNDDVLLQQFHPAHGHNAVLTSPYEVWQFERVIIYGNKAHSSGGDSYPINLETGKACYWDYQTDWGNVFPARLVPCHSDLPANEVGKSVWGHHPVYEPHFFGCYRHHAIAHYGKDFNRRLNYKFDYHYWRDIEGGKLLVFFNKINPEDLVLKAPLHYLYSEYLRP